MKKTYCPYDRNLIFQDKLKEMGLRISFITPEQYVEISKLIDEEVSLSFARKDLDKYNDCEIEIKEILICKILKKIEENKSLKTSMDASKFLGITKSRVSKIFHRSYSELSISYLVKVIFKLDSSELSKSIDLLDFKKSA